MKITFSRKFFTILILALGLSACGGNQSSGPSNEGGLYKVGNPYQVNGEWYYPRENYNYDETGIASWYGDDFHEQRTANGEIFNKNELTAAHKTLPLPTLARVTNLDNGKSIVVRVNDRGPFSGNRLIDVSQRAAQLLGFESQGTAKVRVQVLADESKAIADAMRHYGTTQADAGMTAAPQQSVQSANLEPIKSTAETHHELLNTQPAQIVLQLPVTSHNRLFIQAGSFTVQDNALHMQKTLASVGTTTITTAVVNGKQFYRVRMGPIPDVAQADELMLKVKAAGVIAARTIVD